MRKLDVGIDLDGVVYHFQEAVRQYALSNGFDESDVPYIPIDAQPYSGFYTTFWSWTDDEFDKMFVDGVNAGAIFREGEPLAGALDFINRLRRQGHYIHIITNRNVGTKSHHNTSDWLRENDIPYDSLMFTARKQVVTGLDLMIDDNVQNFIDMTEAGIDTYLYDRPWNQEFDAGFKRVMNWSEFQGAVYIKAGK